MIVFIRINSIHFIKSMEEIDESEGIYKFKFRL